MPFKYMRRKIFTYVDECPRRRGFGSQAFCLFATFFVRFCTRRIKEGRPAPQWSFLSSWRAFYAYNWQIYTLIYNSRSTIYVSVFQAILLRKWSNVINVELDFGYIIKNKYFSLLLAYFVMFCFYSILGLRYCTV